MGDTTPPSLSFWDRIPPFGAVAAAKIASVALIVTPDAKGTKDTVPTLKFANGEDLAGTSLILKYIARQAAAEGKSSSLYGQDALAACQVDQWLDVTAQVVSGLGFEPMCVSINNYLSLRTFLVGYTFTVADVALWGQLQACPMWKKGKSSGAVPHLSRWFDFFAALPECMAAVDELDSKKKAAAEAGASGAMSKGGGDTGSFDVALPGAEKGKVVTRFPPEPSGYLHIGHAKAALLNQYFADMYEGKLLVRFDDTNPSKEKDEFVDNILKDIADLGLKYDKPTYTSDYFPEMLDLGERLIKAGVMYADDTPLEQMRDERMKCIESRCRNRTAEESLALFKEMQAGTEVGLTNCMRFKIDMASPNGALRDPVAYRCNLTPHWRTGTQYKVYPTYDCACPFVDSLEGVSHALRTSEYRDRAAQYSWILAAQQKVWPGLPNVNIWDYSRLNFVYTLLSKRKLTWFVETKRVDGWNDPRMPTVQGIIRRGMQIEALKQFIIGQGASRNVTFQEWDKIWTINKKIIDPVCPRHTAIEVTDKVPVALEGAPDAPERISIPKHKKHPPAGNKEQVRQSHILLEQVDAQQLTEGEEVTLMDWGNAVIKSISKDADGLVSSMSATLNLAGDVKKTKWKLTWLPDNDELIPLTLTDFDYLITKKKVEEDDDFMTLVNENTKFETAALGDLNMGQLNKGDIIQLERKGYYIVDVPFAASTRVPVVLFNIPDGRVKQPQAASVKI
eukprot:jgi/Chrzof1/5740/Cz16g14040.t1_GTS2[v5.2]